MNKDEIIQEIIKLHEQAQVELSDMKRQLNRVDDNDNEALAWGEGFEEAGEHFQNHVDELSKLIRSIGIDSTMSNTIEVSDKQKPLL